MHITEISFKFLFSLHSTVLYIAHFVTVEAFPSFVVETLEKINNENITKLQTIGPENQGFANSWIKVAD